MEAEKNISITINVDGERDGNFLSRSSSGKSRGKKANCRYKYLISFFMLFKKVNEGIRNGWEMSMNIGMK